MNRAGLKTSKQRDLWRKGLEILEGLTIDGIRVDAEAHLEGLTSRYARDLKEHEDSGSLAAASKQLLELETAANLMASALRGLGREARHSISGGGTVDDHRRFDDPIFAGETPFDREGKPLGETLSAEPGCLPSEAYFTEFAKSCLREARACGQLQRQMDGMPKFRPLLCGTPKEALVAGCEDALIRVGRMEKLHDLVRLVAELAGVKPGRKFERECQARMKLRRPQAT